MGLDRKSSTHGVRLRGQVDARARLGFDVKNEVAREVCGKNQRSALGRKQQRRLARTKYLSWIDRAQGWNGSGANRRQADHDHRLRIAKGGRVVQAQIEFVLFGQGQRGDVLILRGMRRTQDAGDIDNRSDVRTVVAAAGVGCGSDLREQVAGWARGQGRDHGLAVRVVEDQLICVLGEARRLLGGGLVEALLLKADAQTSRQ